MLHDILKTALSISEQASVIAMRAFATRNDYQRESKGLQDWVTEADRQVESYIKQMLSDAFPKHTFLGEESGGELTPPGWVIDPIDGTTNFLYGIADFAISMAFVDEQGPAIGIICAPAHNRTIYALRGEGASESGKLLAPQSDRKSELLVGLNLNFQPGIPVEFIRNAQRMIESGHQIRMSGSAAWSLTQVACGELDGCYVGEVNVWDAMAAQLICNEAGLDTAPYFKHTGPIYAFSPDSPLKKLLLD
ncbi:inositol monophosphatase [uncultured Vibrio sp.]|uniref:inositol monophosphatase family protein n=1 Tax=uncultured Vibrio sp. TaxID=114054 RepID=UPI0026037C6B|nr:inositol monophosphatase [uncultured Vibrio sp.]